MSTVKRYWVKIKGPNLRGQFDSNFESQVILDLREDITTGEDGQLVIVTAPRKAGETPSGNVIRRRPSTVVVYAAGEWTSYEIGEVVPRDV